MIRAMEVLLSIKINDKILEATLTQAQPENDFRNSQESRQIIPYSIFLNVACEKELSLINLIKRT